MEEPKSKARTLGAQELEALALVREKAPISVGEMAKAFGVPRGLARTTVLTMMERLRTKGYLTRRKVEGVFHYSPRAGADEAMKDMVAEFVRRSLGGSLAPFVSYLVDSPDLQPEEIERLRKLIDTLGPEEEGK
jgi:predicted transcriptional regulator